MRFIVLLTVALMAWPSASSAQPAKVGGCVGVSEMSSASFIVSCLNGLNQILEDTMRNNEFLMRRISELSVAEVPAGAVVAFDVQSGCPPGWTEFSPGAGRTIVGAGRGNRDQTGTLLAARTFQETGGEEAHTLSIEEMPPHKHSISSRYDDKVHDGFGGSGEPIGLSETFNPTAPTKTGWSRSVHPNFMSEVGGGVAHNNLPPFIALYYCKKESR